MSFLTPYPVFDINPSYEKVFTNFGEKDVKTVMGSGFLGWSVGYFYHYLKPAKKYIYIGTGLGIFVGTVTGYAGVTNELQGFSPNARLLDSYKPLNDRQIIKAHIDENKKNPVRKHFNFFQKEEEMKKYPIISINPNSTDVIKNFEKMDFTRMVLSGCIFLATGFLVYRFMNYGRRGEILDSVARETVFSFIFLNGVYEGIVIEYNGGKSRFYGMEANENEQKKYGRINETRLIKNILEINFPDVPFEDYLIGNGDEELDRMMNRQIERFQWEDVRLADNVLSLLPEALHARFPNADISFLEFDKLHNSSGKANQILMKILEKHGYPVGAASRVLKL